MGVVLMKIDPRIGQFDTIKFNNNTSLHNNDDGPIGVQDRLNLSSSTLDHNDINATKEKIANSLDVNNEEKLIALKMRLNGGTYGVSSLDIAKAMLAT